MEVEVLPDIDRSAYDDFAKSNPGGFPASNDWYDRIKHKEREAANLGWPVVMVPVNASAFIAHCLEQDQICNAEALWRYAKVLHAANIKLLFADANAVEGDTLGIWKDDG